MDRKPDIFEKIAYLGIAIATAKMYVDLHSGRIHSSLGPVLSFFIDFALYYLIYRAGRFVWRKWIKVRVGQEDCEKEPRISLAKRAYSHCKSAIPDGFTAHQRLCPLLSWPLPPR